MAKSVIYFPPPFTFILMESVDVATPTSENTDVDSMNPSQNIDAKKIFTRLPPI